MIDRVLPEKQRALLARMAQRPDAWKGLYLAGGTALALHFGHRISRDFDLFGTDRFDVAAVRRALEEVAPPVLVRNQTDRTFLAEAMGAQISAFHYPYPLLDAALRVEGVPFPVAGLRDLAAMKISAIGQRGVKRDYVDVYFLCRRAPLHEWFSAFTGRYPATRDSLAHYLKALQWFDEADATPMPEMLEEVSWDEVKAFFLREAPAAARKLLGR